MSTPVVSGTCQYWQEFAADMGSCKGPVPIAVQQLLITATRAATTHYQRDARTCPTYLQRLPLQRHVEYEIVVKCEAKGC